MKNNVSLEIKRRAVRFLQLDSLIKGILIDQHWNSSKGTGETSSEIQNGANMDFPEPINIIVT